MSIMTFDHEYDPLAWGSHLPALLACVGASRGDVLEIGVGHFSTPALHCLCGGMDRALVSYEKDDKWRDMFKDALPGAKHAFVTELPQDKSKQYGVVFIDDSPGGENRANHFRNYIDRARFVVVHDYHHDNEEHISPLLAGLNTHVCKMYQPPTLVASRNSIPAAIKCL